MNRRSIIPALLFPSVLSHVYSAMADEISLAKIASQRGLYYGCAVQSKHLALDRDFYAAVQSEAGIITPEWEMKWNSIEQRKGYPDFSRMDEIAKFARNNGKLIRGHTPVWHRSTPSFVTAADRNHAIELFLRHFQSLNVRYFDVISEWDVVNEAINPQDGHQLGLRSSALLRLFGEDYVSIFFDLAASNFNSKKLLYNDYGVDYSDRESVSRRFFIIKLLESLMKKGVQIWGLGIQAHLIAGRWFDQLSFRNFIRDVSELGLKIIITEMDVRDNRIRASVKDRDEAVYFTYKNYLDAALDEKAVQGVVTWGLSDKYSWINENDWSRRADGQLTRGLPLDEMLSRKLAWHGIAESFRSAPLR